MGGPQAMIGWVLGAAGRALPTAWSGASWPRPSPARAERITSTTPPTESSRPARLLKFLFVWQFLFSGPLEVATGAIGMAQYLGYFYPGPATEPPGTGECCPPDGLRSVAWGQVAAMGVMVAASRSLAYRRIAAAGRLMVVLWVGMLVTVAWVIATGLTHFDAGRAFDFPAGAWHVDHGHWRVGLGMALGIAMYDFLGYYQVCYLGDEVADPLADASRARS